MNASIEIDGLRKRFGPVQALDGMTFTVCPGQVTGFVGPNGAGKSTTMRVILGLDAPDAGTATIGGRPYRRKAGGYSLGMRQRLGIAAALLGDPPVLIFDEPFNGMDPEGIVWMKDFLRSLAAQDRTVLVSSHLMGELEALFTEGGAGHLVVIGRGRVIADTSVADLIAAASGNRITLRTTAPADAMTALASAGAEVSANGSGVLTVSNLSSQRVVAALTSHAIPFSEVSAHRATLEQAYMELTGQSVEYRGKATS
jgi:ABC-2 type transport system ATP-binding protein